MMQNISEKTKPTFNFPEFIMGCSVGAALVITAVIYERVNSTHLEQQLQVMDEVSSIKQQLVHSEMENELLSREVKIYRRSHTEIMDQLNDIKSTKEDLCR